MKNYLVTINIIHIIEGGRGRWGEDAGGGDTPRFFCCQVLLRLFVSDILAH